MHSLFLALAEAYILYQDGIVIDENFKTNDPDIYAAGKYKSPDMKEDKDNFFCFLAGPATTYKRILLASHHDHMYYQGEEVGHKVMQWNSNALVLYQTYC